MIRSQQLFASSLVRVLLHDHPPGSPHLDPLEEVADSHVISFVTRGAFCLQHGRRQWRFTPHELLITRPGFAYRCHHEEIEPRDACLSIVCQPIAMARTSGESGALIDSFVPVVALTSRLAYLRHRLLRALADDPEPMEVESIATETAAALSREPATSHSQAQLDWYAQRVDAARDLFERTYAYPHSLGSVARYVGMSPFHFNRVFRQLAGMPPHRYLMRVRMARAADRLLEGDSVTQAALHTGHHNLSHFTRQFRSLHGVSPSRYARTNARLSAC